MSTEMECVQVVEWGGELVRSRVDVPDVGVNEVLLDVEAASVGKTVSNIVDGDLGDDPSDLPRIPGHEIVGRVAERGPGVTHVEEGDLVASYTYLICDHCNACLRGDHSLCEELGGFLSVDIDGGFAEYAKLPVNNVIALPQDIDPLSATVVPDAVATSIHVARERAAVEPGDDVMVLGAGGGVGIHLVQLAGYFGGDVTAVDLYDEKLAKCEELGAAQTWNNRERSLAELAESTGSTFDSIVDFTGDMDLIEESLPLLAERGTMVNLTTFPGRSFEVSPREQVFGEHEVVGSRSFSKYEMKWGGELVAEGVVRPVITDVVGLGDVGGLLDRIDDGAVTGRGAVVP